MWLEYREHGGNRYRVWTEEQAQYGAFKVLQREELVTIITACRLMGYDCIPASDAECDKVM